MDTAVAATYKKGRCVVQSIFFFFFFLNVKLLQNLSKTTTNRDRLVPYDACLRRCMGRMNSSHDEISEDFMKQIELMAAKQKEMEAMQGPPGMM